MPDRSLCRFSQRNSAKFGALRGSVVEWRTNPSDRLSVRARRTPCSVLAATAALAQFSAKYRGASPAQGRTSRKRHVAQNGSAVDRDAKILTLAQKLPRINSSERSPEPNAIVFRQLRWRSRWRMLLEIARRTDDDTLALAADAHSDHVISDTTNAASRSPEMISTGPSSVGI
jgi:hypothetical protein